MEVLVLLALGVPVLMLVAAVLGVIAYVNASRLDKTVKEVESRLARTAARVADIESRLKAPGPAAPGAEPARQEKALAVPAAAPVREVSVAPARPEPPRPEKVMAPAAPPAPPQPVGERVPEAKPAPPTPAAGDLRGRDPWWWAEAKPAPPTAAVAPAVTRAAAVAPSAPAAPAAPARAAAAPRRAVDAEWLSKLEATAGKQWMTWAGVLAIFVGVGFFVKYAFDNDWIGPWGKVLIGAAAGAGLLVLGHFIIRRGMRPLGQGIVGGGLAVLYVSSWAAFGYYHLISQVPAFGAMVAVTVVGMALALHHDAVAISVLATLGGLISPLLVSTGKDPRDALFGYLLLLDLGVLAVGFFKSWRALDLIAFAGTVCLYSGWYAKFYAPAAMLPAMLWLAAFYLAFLMLPFVYHLKTRTPIRGERFAQAVANATAFVVYSSLILYSRHEIVLGLISLGMAGAYVSMGSLTARRIPSDERSVFGFTAMSVTFLTVAAPLLLKLNGLTVAWAAEGPLLLCLAYRFAYRPGRYLAAAVVALAFVRIFQGHWPLHTGPFEVIANTSFATAMCVPLGAGVFAAVGHLFGSRESGPPDLAALGKARMGDLLGGKAGADDRAMKVAVAVAGAFLALILVHAEVYLCWAFNFTHGGSNLLDGQCAASAVWAAGAVAFIVAGLWLRSLASRISGAVALAVALVLCLTLFSSPALPAGEEPFLNSRFVAAMFFAAAAAAHGRLLRTFKNLSSVLEKRFGAFLYALAIGWLLVLHSMELHSYAEEVIGGGDAATIWLLARMAAVWCIGAFCYLILGVSIRSRAMRWAGALSLSLAVFLAAISFGFDDRTVYTLLLSPRFTVALVVVLSAMGYSYVMRRCPAVCDGEEAKLAKVVQWSPTLLLFFFLSVEVYGHFRRSIPDPNEARYGAQMALSLVWALYAVGMLLLGFWRRVRPLRFVALGLFALTAAKLILVDMATVKQIYRIVVFIGVGVLFVGAAYLYHRVERIIEPRRPGGPAPDAKP